MKVFPFTIPKAKDEAILYQEDGGLQFYDKLHQHEETQISYIKSGEGTILVGDTITQYQEGDILVIGSNLPHVFKSDPNVEKLSKRLSIFFTYNSFGKDFFDLSTFRNIQPFFENCKNGFIIKRAPKKIVNQFLKFKKENEFDRFLIFFKIINSLCQSEKKMLSNFIYNKPFSDREGKRMQLVLDFIMNNYQTEISLEKIASVSNMTKNAFCRYFKMRTNKPFFQYLIDVRIEHACKLLLKNHELSVMEIAELCGFNNISNFNRKFKELKEISPLKYKKLHS